MLDSCGSSHTLPAFHMAEAILEAYREGEADISIYISQAGAEPGRVRQQPLPETD